MSTTNLGSLTVSTPVVQSAPATDATHLVRLGEVVALLAGIYKGVWSGATTYAQGNVTQDSTGALWLSLQNTNLNHTPSEGAWWTSFMPAGTAGASAYVYVGYASDSSGTGFSLTPGDSLTYAAFKVSATVIASPQASDFTGLWRKSVGPTGAAGAVWRSAAGVPSN